MKFAAFLALAASAAATAVNVERDAYADVLALRSTYSYPAANPFEARDLQERACVDTDCDCTNIRAGLFCGDGKLNCKPGHVYQCSGGAYACHYGPRDSCKGCTKVFCK